MDRATSLLTLLLPRLIQFMCQLLYAVVTHASELLRAKPFGFLFIRPMLQTDGAKTQLVEKSEQSSRPMESRILKELIPH